MNKKLLLIVVLVAILGGGGAYYWFVMRGDDPIAAEDTSPDVAAATGLADCPPGSTGVTPETADPAAGASGAGAGATPPAATPPATQPPAATVDPETGAPVTPPASPPAGDAGAAPVAAGVSDGTTINAAGASYDGYASDGVISAAAAGTPSATDPAAAGGAAGETDPGVAPADPNSVPPVTPSTDPAAAGTTDPGVTNDPSATVDPCAETGAPADPGTGATGATATGAPAGAGAAGAKANLTRVSDGTNGGNNALALELSTAVAQIAQKNSLNFAVESTLLPSGGSLKATTPKAKRTYRASVVAAVLRIKIVDQASMQQWSTSSKKTRTNSVTSFLKLVQQLYPKAQRSVSIIDTNNTLLAVGDQGASGAPTIRILG